VWSVSLSLALAPLRILEFIDGESPLTGFHEVCHPINFGALNVILVTSANGHIGKEVVNLLRSRGMKARAFVRKAKRAAARLRPSKYPRCHNRSSSTDIFDRRLHVRRLRAHVRVLQPARLNRQLERTRLATRKKADRPSRIPSASKCRKAVTSAEQQ
jgi:hypothetical protein